MNSFTRLKLYSGIEICQIIISSTALRILKVFLKVLPPGLGRFRHLLITLEKQKIDLTRDGDSVFFKYPINQRTFTIFLKRNSSDPDAFEQIVLNNEYAVIVNLLKSFNITPETMVDAGANIGLTTLYFKSYFPDLRVVTLEPLVETFQRMQKNFSANSLTGINSLAKGLWSKKTFLKGATTFGDGLDWAFRLLPSEDAAGTIETVSMPDILSDYKFQSIDILKIDIEGGESEVLNSNSNLEWLKIVKIIAVEIHDEYVNRSEIEGLLKTFGFELQHSGELTIGMNKSLLRQ